MRLKLSLIIFLTALFVRLPLYQTNFYKTPDAIEYLNPVYNLIAGQGFVSTLKVAFTDNQTLPHPAIGQRPVGFSLFLVPISLINPHPHFIQLCLLIIHSFNAVLIFLLFSRFLNPSLSLLGGLLFALNPNILITNRLIMPEPAYLFFVLLSLICYFYSPPQVMLSGIFLGLAYLIRPETLFLIIPLTLKYLFSRQFKPLLSLLLPLLLFTLPYFILNYQINHSPFALLENHHYQIKHFSLFFTHFNLPLTPPLQFIRQNFAWILHQQLKNFSLHLQSLLSFTWLGLLTFPLFICPKKFFQTHWPLLFYSLASFFLVSLTWSIFAEPERMFTLPFTFLLLFSLKGFSRLPHLFKLLIILPTFLIYFAFDFHRLTWARTDLPNYQYSFNQQLTAWINQHTQSKDIITYIDPWTIYLTTHRHSIIMPQNLNSDNLPQFINIFQPDYLIIPSRYPSSDLTSSSLLSPVFSTSLNLYTIYQVNSP